jgi:hypothetical protein
VYVVSLIDHGPPAFARAKLATLASVFEHAALLAPPAVVAADGGGRNLVAVASGAPIDFAAVTAALADRDLDWTVVDGPELDESMGSAPVLTDDFAPVDQLLTPSDRGR